MHRLFHGGVQSDNILLYWNAAIDFELVDQTVDPDHILAGMTTKIFFESGVNQIWILIQETLLGKIVDRSVAKVE